eukprot:14800825-Ditylum_brightwellii.AAC.1
MLMYDNISYMKQIVRTIKDPITQDLAVELLKILEVSMNNYIPDHIQTSPCTQAKIGYALSGKTNSNIIPCACMAETYGMKIAGRLHPDTQMGKDLVDAHFSMVMKHVICYLNESNDVDNTIQLVESLKSNGGISNTVVELLYLN